MPLYLPVPNHVRRYPKYILSALLTAKHLLLCGFFFSSCTFEETANETDERKALLTPPQAFANPKNDDEYFFNYRLAEFAPSTEPFIKET
ncbi:MAG: hypothetical protein LBP64_11485, partial [Tannerella sp.]|nr:hypothetical protein [Tannerella sp.]